MITHPVYRLFVLLTFFSTPAFAQTNVQYQASESELISFQAIGTGDTNRAILHVQIIESGTEDPVQGATVLLRRDIDKMHGKVSNPTGYCTFTVAPGEYAFRVQMTGLKTLEKQGLRLEPGKIYEMKLAMAF